jgi:tetratricopeptide (TPR) repeat protein
MALIGLVSPVYSETSVSQPKYQTIAHEILKLESEVEGIPPNYDLLDALIDEVKSQISPKPSYSSSREEAITVLQQIAWVLRKKNIQVGDAMLLIGTCTPQDEGDTRKYIADCDTLSFLYLGIGEALDLPLRLVSLTDHTFIRWHFSDNTYLNWETTTATEWTDSAYRSWYNSTHNDPIPPEQKLRSLERSEIFAIVHYNLGNSLTQKGRYGDAIANYTKTLTINPLYANAYYQRGKVWYEKGDDDKAIVDFTQVIAINPHDANAFQNRGSAWTNKGEYEKAIADFTEALELNPHNADALYNRGSVWYMKGGDDKAFADFNRALEINPDDAGALSFRGMVWKKRGNYEEAHADFTRALELNPWSAETNNAMAWLLATCRDKRYRNGKKAISLALKALVLQPALRGYYLDTLAAAWAETGNFQQAVAIQEKAILLIRAEVTAEELSEYTKRLELYKKHKPYRE